MAKQARRPRTKVSRDGLLLELDGPVTLTRLHHALETWTEFLREVGRSVVGSDARDAVRFVVSDARGGSFAIAARPEAGRPDVSTAAVARVSKAIATGIRTLERQATRPKHFSDAALEKLKALVLDTTPEVTAMRVGNGAGPSVAVTNRLVDHVDAVLGPEVESIGTVEGFLEGLIIRGRRRFLITEVLTRRQVTCYFADRVTWQQIHQAFGQRVAATGLVRSRRSGEKLSITVHTLFVFPLEEQLPTADSVLGILAKQG